MEMSCHRRRNPAFPFVEAELAVESSSAKDSACSALAGHGTLITEEIKAQPWHQSAWAIGSNCNTGRHEGFASLQQSFNMSRACQSLYPNANRVQHMQSIPSLETYNWSRSSSSTEGKSFGAYLTPCNAGSLVLDTSTGELVNALKMTPKEILEAKAAAAARSHSEAERRRRERINSHLATLRTILPSSVKSDKAALLAEVIDHVKKLKREVSDTYCYGSMPSETDELLVETDPNSTDPNSEAGMVKIRVSMSCDDRPDLMTDLKQAFDTLKLHTIKVEMSTLGCRMKNDLLVATRDGCVDDNVDALIKRVQEALRLVMERPGRGELLQGKYSKRQRLMIADGQADCYN